MIPAKKVDREKRLKTKIREEAKKEGDEKPIAKRNPKIVTKIRNEDKVRD